MAKAARATTAIRLNIMRRGGHKNIGGADGIVNRLLKKTEEKPLNSRVCCHLLIFPMSLRNPSRFFGHPYNAPFWQQLATVDNGLSEVASRRAIRHNPVSGQLPVSRSVTDGFQCRPEWATRTRGQDFSNPQLAYPLHPTSLP